MPMQPYTMEVPWAGSERATIALANSSMASMMREFAKANKIKAISAVARFQGFFEQNGETVIKYRIESEQRG